MKKISLILIIFLIFSLLNVYSDEFYIKYKIDNQIITNYDIEKEKIYLGVLNPALKKINKSQIQNLATRSIIREKIKIIELEKYYDLNVDENKDILINITNNLFLQSGLNSKDDIKKYLSSFNLDYEWVLQKIKIETYWNNLIMKKYASQIQIDRDQIMKDIELQINQLKKKRKLLLSEILFKKDDKIKFEDQKAKILESIDKIGFENTASIYSISDTAKTGGVIGWVEEETFSKQIFEEVKNLKKEDFSKFIKINNNYLLLKINDVKEIEQRYNRKKILEKRISLKQNQQLEIFSNIYFEKIKQNIIINEK